MEAPGAHQRLDRHVERPARRAPEALGEREHRREIVIDVHGAPSGPAVQLAQIARVVEQREPRLHSAQLRERGAAGIEPRLLRLGVHHQVHRLAHRPRPALDEDVAAGGPTGDEDRPESRADGPDELASAHGGSSPQAEAWARCGTALKGSERSGPPFRVGTTRGDIHDVSAPDRPTSLRMRYDWR